MPCTSPTNYATETFQSFLALCHLRVASAGSGRRGKKPSLPPPPIPLLSPPSHPRPPQCIQTLRVGTRSSRAPEGTDSARDGVPFTSPTLDASAVPPLPPPPHFQQDLLDCSLVLFNLFIFFRFAFFLKIPPCWSLERPPALQFPGARLARRALRAGRVVSWSGGQGLTRPRFLQIGSISLGDPTSW